MSATVQIEQTATGWRVTVTDADETVIETDGASLAVALHPDDDDAPAKALDVTLD